MYATDTYRYLPSQATPLHTSMPLSLSNFAGFGQCFRSKLVGPWHVQLGCDKISPIIVKCFLTILSVENDATIQCAQRSTGRHWGQGVTMRQDGSEHHCHVPGCQRQKSNGCRRASHRGHCLSQSNFSWIIDTVTSSHWRLPRPRRHASSRSGYCCSSYNTGNLEIDELQCSMYVQNACCSWLSNTQSIQNTIKISPQQNLFRSFPIHI